jgi:hypothetical protein
MIKKSVVALATVAAMAGIALPAMASESTSGFDADYVLSELQAQGVNASRVEEWGTLVRAFVTTADGRQVMQYFEPVTLKPANT